MQLLRSAHAVSDCQHVQATVEHLTLHEADHHVMKMDFKPTAANLLFGLPTCTVPTVHSASGLDTSCATIITPRVLTAPHQRHTFQYAYFQFTFTYYIENITFVCIS